MENSTPDVNLSQNIYISAFYYNLLTLKDSISFLFEKIPQLESRMKRFEEFIVLDNSSKQDAQFFYFSIKIMLESIVKLSVQEKNLGTMTNSFYCLKKTIDSNISHISTNQEFDIISANIVVINFILVIDIIKKILDTTPKRKHNDMIETPSNTITEKSKNVHHDKKQKTNIQYIQSKEIIPEETDIRFVQPKEIIPEEIVPVETDVPRLLDAKTEPKNEPPPLEDDPKIKSKEDRKKELMDLYNKLKQQQINSYRRAIPNLPLSSPRLTERYFEQTPSCFYIDPTRLDDIGENRIEDKTTQTNFKTKLCRTWLKYGECNFDGQCKFAHGKNDLRKLD